MKAGLGCDRELKRVLYLDEPISILLHYEAKYLIYGVPAPSLPYIFSSDDVDYRSYDPSEWVYSTRDPLKEHLGLEYDETIGETPQMPPVEEDSDSSVSLGSEYDYAGDVNKDPVAQDGMIVDEAPKMEEPRLVACSEILKNTGRLRVTDSREANAEIQGYSRGRPEGRYSRPDREHHSRSPSPYPYQGRNLRQPQMGSRSPRRYHRRDDPRHYSLPESIIEILTLRGDDLALLIRDQDFDALDHRFPGGWSLTTVLPLECMHRLEKEFGTILSVRNLNPLVSNLHLSLPGIVDP